MDICFYSLGCIPRRGIALFQSFVTTFKWAAGSTISHRGCLLGWTPGSHEWASAEHFSIVSHHSPAPCTPANGALCRSCMHLFWSCLWASAHVSFCLPFFFPLYPKASIFHTPTQLSPPLMQPSSTLLLTHETHSSFWGSLHFVMYPASSCRGSCPGQLLWYYILRYLVGNGA